MKIASVILIVSLALVTIGGMRRPKPIDDMTVLKWNATAPPEGATYSWQGQYKFGSDEWKSWVEILIGDFTVLPGDCLAYPRGLAVEWRSCWVNTYGNVAKLPDGNDACIPAVQEPITEPCTRIYNIAGVEFEQDIVDQWNAEHVSPSN